MAARGGEDFMSDEVVINKCCMCTKKNTKTEATTYCVDCKDYYCAACVNIHTAVPSMEHHKLLDKSDFKSARSSAGSLPSFPTQRCDEHKSEVLNMYCQDHDEVACGTCINLYHRSCKDLFSVPENIGNLCERSEMSNVEHSIQVTRTRIEDFKKSKEAHKQLLTKSLDTAVDSVKTFKQELQTLLNEIENDTILELKKQFERIENSLAEEIKIAENQIDALKRMASQLQTIVGNKVEEFVCVKSFEKLTRNREMDKQQTQPDELISFSADQSVTSFLRKRKVFGKVTCQLGLPTVPITRLTATTQSNLPNVIRSKTKLYKVAKHREIDINLPDDTHDTNIWGSCITDDGYLLLADSWNSKLKRLNLSTEIVTDSISLISRPNAVCQVSKTEAAVSLHNSTIQFVKLGDKLTATRTLTINHYCGGLAFSKGKLFISNFGNSVYIHDKKGKELKVITDASGKDIFKDNRNIAINDDGDRVLVADQFVGLITLDHQGNYLSTLTNNEIQATHCWGVCTDGSNVFVCNMSNSVVQIGQNNKRLGQIGTIYKPTSLCYDSMKRKLYVTQWGSGVLSVEELV